MEEEVYLIVEQHPAHAISLFLLSIHFFPLPRSCVSPLYLSVVVVVFVAYLVEINHHFKRPIKQKEPKKKRRPYSYPGGAFFRSCWYHLNA